MVFLSTVCCVSVLINIVMMRFSTEFSTLFSQVWELGNEYIPHSYDMAYGTCKNEEMENRVHVAMVIETVECSSCNITDAFSHYPTDGLSIDSMYQWTECH